VESWLHNLLCLDAATHLPAPPAKLPHPDSCELYYVERDTLFSFHKASEAFLQRVRRRYCRTINDCTCRISCRACGLLTLCLGGVFRTMQHHELPKHWCL